MTKIEDVSNRMMKGQKRHMMMMNNQPQYDTYVKLMTSQDEAKLLARGVEHNGLPSSLFPSQIHLEAEEKGKGEHC